MEVCDDVLYYLLLLLLLLLFYTTHNSHFLTHASRYLLLPFSQIEINLNEKLPFARFVVVRSTFLLRRT